MHPIMHSGILQANLNHARRAQDLLQWRSGLVIIAEPYRVLEDHPC